MKPLPPPHRPGQSWQNQAFFAAAGFALGLWLLRGMIGAHEPVIPGGVGMPLGESPDLTCIALGAAHYPTVDPKTLSLARIEKRSQETDIGRATMNAAIADGLRVCFNPAMAVPKPSGNRTVGAYILGRKRVDLNPDVDTDMLTTTMVHEARHRVQEVLGVNFLAEGNIPEAERMIVAWLTEADARLVTILSAREAHRNGDLSQMERLMGDSAYRPMIYAMIAAQVQNPDDRAAEMAAAIKAFRQSRELIDLYDPDFIKTIVTFSAPYDPTKPRQILVHDQMLSKLGDMGPYGNYMTNDLKKFIRASFTDQDWRDMKAAQDCLQKRKLGQIKGVCPSWPRPSA